MTSDATDMSRWVVSFSLLIIFQVLFIWFLGLRIILLHPWNHPLHTGFSLSLWKIFFLCNSQNSRSTSAWIFANTFESLSQWRRHLFRTHCQLVQNMHPIQQSREQTPEDEIKESAFGVDKVFQNATSSEKSDAPSLLRFTTASSGTLWIEDRTGNSVRCWLTHRNQLFETNVRLCIILAWWCLPPCCHLNHPNYWNPPGSALWSVGTSCVWPNLAPLCYHLVHSNILMKPSVFQRLTCKGICVYLNCCSAYYWTKFLKKLGELSVNCCPSTFFLMLLH